ncbi:three-helix bundle dimerization domain-containing protein [Citricoccus sp.]|uniref:arsenate-mycothiol transferase ArsC n=1 Tax=Citricoccus sp. TaxID=1978372 RepID=UPI0028BD63BB|nr:low molecular weight phosphatase family protein [Citricoccus sp.]
MTTHQNPSDTALDHQGSDATDVAEAAGSVPELDRHVLERTASHLHERYAQVADRATVDRILKESYREMDRRATVKTFLPLLAGHFADSQLRSLGIAQGIIESPLPRVLFIDDANAGRSQMAASLMLKHSEGRVTARSAGLAPVGHLYEDAVAIMAEIGIPLDQAYPKPLSGDVHAAAQFVITLSCGDQVEQLPGKDYREWDIPAFVGRPLEDIRAMRDDLEARVLDLMREVGPDTATGTEYDRRDLPPLQMSA